MLQQVQDTWRSYTVTMTDNNIHPFHLGRNQGSLTSRSAAAILVEKQAQPPSQGAADHAATAPQTSLEQQRQALPRSAGQVTDAEEGVAGPSWPGPLSGWLNDHPSASRDIDQQTSVHLQPQAPATVEDQLNEQSADKPAEQPDAQPVGQPHIAAGGKSLSQLPAAMVLAALPLLPIPQHKY